MATLLVVHLSPTDTVRALTDAVLAGARHEDIEGVEVVERAARIVAAPAARVGEAEHDLTNIGLILDTLKIQNVTDDVGYLDSIGRMRSADIRKKAQIAEASAKAEAPCPTCPAATSDWIDSTRPAA